MPEQQVLYCASDIVTAYWETNPQIGDVISISTYKLKPGKKINCAIIKKEKILNNSPLDEIHELYYLLDNFYIEVFTREISKDTPKEYLFSGALATRYLFGSNSNNAIADAIIYPSVQRKLNGYNIAIKNEIIFEKYDLIDVTTEFILGNYPVESYSRQIIPRTSFRYTTHVSNFDIEKRLIIYTKEQSEIFTPARGLQEGVVNGTILPSSFLSHDMITITNTENPVRQSKVYCRNDKVSVLYKDGTLIKGIKYKKVAGLIESGECTILE